MYVKLVTLLCSLLVKTWTLSIWFMCSAAYSNHSNRFMLEIQERGRELSAIRSDHSNYRQRTSRKGWRNLLDFQCRLILCYVLGCHVIRESYMICINQLYILCCLFHNFSVYAIIVPSWTCFHCYSMKLWFQLILEKSYIASKESA